jgi:hypothetical protein
MEGSITPASTLFLTTPLIKSNPVLYKKLKQSVPRELEVWTLTLEANTAFLHNDVNTSHRIALRPTIDGSNEFKT